MIISDRFTPYDKNHPGCCIRTYTVEVLQEISVRPTGLETEKNRLLRVVAPLQVGADITPTSRRLETDSLDVLQEECYAVRTSRLADGPAFEQVLDQPRYKNNDYLGKIRDIFTCEGCPYARK